MTAETPRRGMIRPISDLPASPGGAELIEVEVAKKFYQRGVPSASYLNQTVIQLPMATAGFPDDKGHAVTVSGPVTLDTTTTPFSAKFSAGASINQGIHVAAPATGDDFNVGGSPIWTMEGWFKTTQVEQFATLCGRDSGAGGSGTWALLINNGTSSDGKIAMYTGWGSGAPAIVSRLSYADGIRHHVAIVHTGVLTYVYVDGVLENMSVVSPLATATILAQDILLGGSGYATRQFVGNMDNWRIVNGVALYTGHTYTVPTPPFPSS